MYFKRQGFLGQVPLAGNPKLGQWWWPFGNDEVPEEEVVVSTPPKYPLPPVQYTKPLDPGSLDTGEVVVVAKPKSTLPQPITQKLPSFMYPPTYQKPKPSGPPPTYPPVPTGRRCVRCPDGSFKFMNAAEIQIMQCYPTDTENCFPTPKPPPPKPPPIPPLYPPTPTFDPFKKQPPIPTPTPSGPPKPPIPTPLPQPAYKPTPTPGTTGKATCPYGEYWDGTQCKKIERPSGLELISKYLPFITGGETGTELPDTGYTGAPPTVTPPPSSGFAPVMTGRQRIPVANIVRR